MAINFNKYKDALTAAWKDVLNDKTDTDWALFSYEGQTNDLKVTSTGAGGIEEMIDDLNSGKIMYAFLKVNDPKTSLPKCVLINWQGEGANIVRKGTCANHVRDVGNFFTGAHVTLNARNEEEVEPQLIIEKVAKSSGSAYSFKAPRSENNGDSKPIGTNYQRVNPVKEINAIERNQFWLKEEREEKERIKEERTRRDADKEKYEAEMKRREATEAAERDAIDKKRNENIEKMRQAEANILHAENKSQSGKELERLERELAEELVVNRSEQLRKQRNEEAQQLIGKSTTNARSVFERNTAAGQMRSHHAPGKPLRTSIPQQASHPVNTITLVENSTVEHNVQKIVPDVEKSPVKNVINIENIQSELQNDDAQGDSDEQQDQFSTIKRSPKSPNDVASENIKNADIFNLVKDTVIENVEVCERRRDDKLPQIVTEQQIVDEVIYQDLGDDLGLQARALYDYQAADDTEITFDPGDVISHIDQIDEGWWQGLGPDGTFGLFPANYVELLPQ